jgi:3-hydroxyisobutyrate dehydrogenase-like beta-hydroxyacid dehydrogenase
MAKCAFIGLGIMGYPMAGHLQAKGHEVRVYNRTAAKAEAWVGQHGGRAAATPRAAAEGAELVFMCVGNDDDIRSVAYGDDGALAGLGDGCVLVDHTTASADIARELEQAAKDQGKQFVDAPVSGGQAGAENGTLTIMCGGAPAAFERARPVMEAYGRAVTLMGPAGAGQLTKMVNQICIAGLVQGSLRAPLPEFPLGISPLALVWRRSLREPRQCVEHRPQVERPLSVRHLHQRLEPRLPRLGRLVGCSIELGHRLLQAVEQLRGRDRAVRLQRALQRGERVAQRGGVEPGLGIVPLG